MSGKLRREDMLRELELLPVWRERSAQAAKAAMAQEEPTPMAEAAPQPHIASATIAPAASETGLADAALAQHSTEYSSEPPVSDSQDKITPDAAATPAADEPRLPVEEIPPGEPAAAETLPLKDMPSPALSPIGDGRVDIIQRMAWPALQQAVEHCPACNLCQTRTKTVFGVGDQDADWLFVGEAPGAEEDRKGEPFVGQAGRLLDNMLAAINLKRGDNVYIANVLKCRPPDNRDPHGEEVMQCDPYLKRQVALIQPKLIVALGKFAAQSLLNSKSSIGAMRGTLHDYNGVPVIVTYHPAYLLRSPSEKAKAWEDLCYARDTMQGLQAGLQSAGEAPSKHKS